MNPRQRMVIAGGPRTGKTTLAVGDGGPGPDVPVRHTDDLVGRLEWSAASEEVARWFDEPGPWIVEGVAAVRALRKWCAAHAEGAPCDVVWWLSRPRVALTPGQLAMAKGCATVWAEVKPELVRRGVDVKELP